MSDETSPRYSLTPARYLEFVRADADLLADTAERIDLDLGVPPCPGWTVRDAVLHTAQVYLHKISCTQFGVMPKPWPPEPWPPATAVADPIGFFRRTTGELLTELASRDPDSPSATWWPEDQTVGFWCRRMAHETAVHRVDVQSAASVVTPVDADLALDGVDEVLELMFSGDWSDVTPEEWEGVDPMAGVNRPIDLVVGERRWRVTMRADANEVLGLSGEPIVGGDADAAVSAGASDLLLWAWGRVPDSRVAVSGDAELVKALRDRLALATA